ncbi:MAG: hypothetical protein U0797_08080 [Gemmataceae bacterium]
MDTIDVVVLVVIAVASIDYLVWRVRQGRREQEILCWYCPDCKVAIPADEGSREVISKRQSN